MSRKVKELTVIFGLLFACVFLFQNIPFTQAKEQEYPTKPIEFILTLSAGGEYGPGLRAPEKPPVNPWASRS